VILLDTNVVSQLVREHPDERVLEWLAQHDLADLWLSVVTGAELLTGVAYLPEGRRRDAQASGVHELLETVFEGRVLSFEAHAAIEYADVMAARRRAGRPISVPDAMIAAGALAARATLATRNTKDFEGLGLDLVDPWTA
jgi:predicted nucleic acid-binding protein